VETTGKLEFGTAVRTPHGSGMVVAANGMVSGEYLVSIMSDQYTGPRHVALCAHEFFSESDITVISRIPTKFRHTRRK
jgi:hypothetical protein